MNPATLASLALTILFPYIAEVGKEFATKVGDAAFEQAKRLYDVIHDRFDKEAPKDDWRASEALETFKKDPDNAATVQTKIVRILQDAPDFARGLSQKVQSGPIQNFTVRRDSRAKDTDIATTDSRSYQRYWLKIIRRSRAPGCMLVPVWPKKTEAGTGKRSRLALLSSVLL